MLSLFKYDPNDKSNLKKLLGQRFHQIHFVDNAYDADDIVFIQSRLIHPEDV